MFTINSGVSKLLKENVAILSLGFSPHNSTETVFGSVQTVIDRLW